MEQKSSYQSPTLTEYRYLGETLLIGSVPSGQIDDVSYEADENEWGNY